VRVLYVTQGFPEDSMVGGQISSFYRIVQLTRAGHEVTALCLVPSGKTVTEPRSLEAIARVVPVRDVPSPSPARYAANLVDPLPWPIRRYASRVAAARLTRLLEEDPPDLVFVNSVHGATLLPGASGASGPPRLLFAPNVQSETLSLYARFQRNPAVRAYALIQASKMRAFEASALAGFDLVLSYTTRDRDGLLALAPTARVEIVPIALDVAALGSGSRNEDLDVLFISYLGWPPNRDSLRWFASQILPRIRRLRPRTTVAIVGAGAPRWAEELDDPEGGVRVLGRVDDALPHFRRARVAVVPLRIGSGVRVKIVQAMAAGTPVVTTSKGREGLLGEDGKHYVVRDDAASFARGVVDLLESPDGRRALAQRARTLAAERHDAMAARPPLVEACERLAANRRDRDGDA